MVWSSWFLFREGVGIIDTLFFFFLHVVEEVDFAAGRVAGSGVSRGMVVHGLAHGVHDLGVERRKGAAERAGDAGERGRARVAGHVRRGGVGVGLAVLACRHLGHAADTAAAQAHVLVAVAPRVDGALDKASLATERAVELGKGPADAVALRLVCQAVSAVLLLGAACSGVHAVLLLEVGSQLVRVDRLDVAADRVLHLDAVSRVLKGNPLHAVAVLADHEGRRGGNRAGGSVGVNAAGVAGTTRALHLLLLLLVLLLLLRVAAVERSLGLLGELERQLVLHLWSRAVVHAALGVSLGMLRMLRVVLLVLLRSMLLLLLLVVSGVVTLVLLLLLGHVVLGRRVGEHHIRLGCHGLLRVVGVLSVGRSGRVRVNGLVLMVRLVIHGGRHVLRGLLAVDAPVLVVLGRRGHRGGRVGLRSMVGHGRVRSPWHLRSRHHVCCICAYTRATHVSIFVKHKLGYICIGVDQVKARSS